MSEPVFPPLMSGHAVTGAMAAFDTACARAAMGCDAGLVVYNLGADAMQAALVLAPEVPLTKAMAMLPLCAVGFQNALGVAVDGNGETVSFADAGARLNGGHDADHFARDVEERPAAVTGVDRR